MSDESPINRYAQNAKYALDAYEKQALPTSSGDPRAAGAVMGALIGDLEHYADAHGIDFADVLAKAHEAYAAEVGDQTRYAVGDEVRLITRPQRCGTITGITTQHGEQLYHVHVAGVPYTHAERGADLEPATSFPLVSTSLGVIDSALKAEEALVELASRARLTGPHRDPTAKPSCDRLITALTWWSGTTHHELSREVSPKIAQRIIQGSAPEGWTNNSPAQLAGQSFPYDLHAGIPHASDTAPTATPGSDPAGRPTRTPGSAA